MDEFLYELKDHSAGLNCGRWDYMFSFIKTLRNDPTKIFPDRGLVGMDQGFLRSYTQARTRQAAARGGGGGRHEVWGHEREEREWGGGLPARRGGCWDGRLL